MKSLTFSLTSLLLLSACGTSSVTASYELAVRNADATQQEQLIEQSLHVMERRLERMGELMKQEKVEKTASGAIVTISVESELSIEQLTKELQRPFDFRVMAQVDEGVQPDIFVDGHGGFVATGITGADLAWVEGRTVEETNTGEVRLIFTEDGLTKMADLVERMQGKSIGLFVHTQLVSKLMINFAELQNEIVIRGIPTPELATIFSDDVNVGTHVTFTPVP